MYLDKWQSLASLSFVAAFVIFSIMRIGVQIIHESETPHQKQILSKRKVEDATMHMIKSSGSCKNCLGKLSVKRRLDQWLNLIIIIKCQKLTNDLLSHKVHDMNVKYETERTNETSRIHKYFGSYGIINILAKRWPFFVYLSWRCKLKWTNMRSFNLWCSNRFLFFKWIRSNMFQLLSHRVILQVWLNILTANRCKSG